MFSQSEDNFTKFLKDGVMCRKKCLNILSKLVKLKKEIEPLESDVVEKFGDVVVSNGFGSLGSLVPSDAESPNAAATIRSRQSCTYSTPKSRNQKTVGVRVIV